MRRLRAPGPQCAAGVLHPVGTPSDRVRGRRQGDDRDVSPARGRPLASFPRLNQNGYPTTLAIVGAIVTRTCGISWYRVKLPMRPNGAVGYVRPADVLVEEVTTRIVVDISERRLFVYRAGRLAPDHAGRRRLALRRRLRPDASTSTSGS